ncbi:YbfB/YjiJ family MFS transporter [Streptomyces sp. NPDC096132]|uniref:YbfB/YjiJ family MFS transporter n=1 Tax=Streptomyces sp. NPDC096132 TaxID=3366075 RepID=UPI00382BC274
MAGTRWGHGFRRRHDPTCPRQALGWRPSPLTLGPCRPSRRRARRGHGYLVGALGGILVPALVRSPILLRVSLLVLTGTLAAMPATHTTEVWIALRLLAGVAGALIFVIAVSSLARPSPLSADARPTPGLSQRRRPRAHSDDQPPEAPISALFQPGQADRPHRRAE